MEADLAKEISELMAKTLEESKPAKHLLLTKWLTVVGAVALVSGWATLNTVVARWQAIPVVQARTEQAAQDVADMRESVAEHKAAQAVEMTKLSMQLESMAKIQVEQKEQLTEIGRKIDRIASRGIIGDPKP